MVDTLTKEDVRDLTRILAVEHVATLMQLIPERIGSPLSLNALKEDVEISYTAVKNAIRAMELTYALFLLSPYSKKVARAVKKERKAYFYDWGRCRVLAKLHDDAVDRHHLDQARALGKVPYVQLAQEGNIYKKPAPGVVRVSAGRFF
jgi:predicted AAA+ superfamily ATPase